MVTNREVRRWEAMCEMCMKRMTASALGLIPVAGVLLGMGAGARAWVQEPEAPARRPGVKVLNRVEGETTILTCLPAGTLVKRNDVIIELDDAEFRALLAELEVILVLRQAEYARAEEDRKLAELEWKEHEQAAAVRLREAQNAVKTARTHETEARAKYEEEVDSGPAPRLLLRHQLEVDWKAAKLEREKAESRLELLEKFEIPRRRKELEAARDRAVSEAGAKQTILQLERVQEQKLRAQIERCRVLAPVAGRVIYPDPVGGPGEAMRSVIAAGEAVRARQVLAIIEPVKPGEAGR